MSRNRENGKASVEKGREEAQSGAHNSSFEEKASVLEGDVRCAAAQLTDPLLTDITTQPFVRGRLVGESSLGVVIVDLRIDRGETATRLSGAERIKILSILDSWLLCLSTR